MRHGFIILGVVLFAVVALFSILYWIVEPAPPTKIRMAVASSNELYRGFGERYRELLGAQGVEVELVETSGPDASVALLERFHETGGVDIAIVETSSTRKLNPEIVGLGAIDIEPFWLFVRSRKQPTRMSDLTGLRMAIGVEGSATAIVSVGLLEVNGLDGESVSRVALGGTVAAEALLAGDVDAAAFLTGGELELMRTLMVTPGVRLMNFDRVRSYAQAYRRAQIVSLGEGVLDFAANVPPETVTLLAAVGGLVAHEDLHPALVQVILQTATKIHGEGDLFSDAGRFPSPHGLAVPLSDDARRFYDHGPGFLSRHLPFWAANFITRLIILLIPVLTVLIPFLGIFPPTYSYYARYRVMRWYRRVMAIERAALTEQDAGRRADLLSDLDLLEEKVRRMRVPTLYSDYLYHLRFHIRLTRQLIESHGPDMAIVPAERPDG